MSMENVKNFYEFLKKNENAKRELEGNLKLRDLNSLGEKNKENAILEETEKIAKKYNFNISKDDITKYLKVAAKELNEEDLLDVSGGITTAGVAMGLLMLTGISLGSGAAVKMLQSAGSMAGSDNTSIVQMDESYKPDTDFTASTVTNDSSEQTEINKELKQDENKVSKPSFWQRLKSRLGLRNKSKSSSLRENKTSKPISYNEFKEKLKAAADVNSSADALGKYVYNMDEIFHQCLWSKDLKEDQKAKLLYELASDFSSKEKQYGSSLGNRVLMGGYCDFILKAASLEKNTFNDISKIIGDFERNAVELDIETAKKIVENKEANLRDLGRSGYRFNVSYTVVSPFSLSVSDDGKTISLGGESIDLDRYNAICNALEKALNKNGVTIDQTTRKDDLVNSGTPHLQRIKETGNKEEFERAGLGRSGDIKVTFKEEKKENKEENKKGKEDEQNKDEEKKNKDQDEQNKNEEKKEGQGEKNKDEEKTKDQGDKNKDEEKKEGQGEKNKDEDEKKQNEGEKNKEGNGKIDEEGEKLKLTWEAKIKSINEKINALQPLENMDANDLVDNDCDEIEKAIESFKEEMSGTNITSYEFKMDETGTVTMQKRTGKQTTYEVGKIDLQKLEQWRDAREEKLDKILKQAEIKKQLTTLKAEHDNLTGKTNSNKRKQKREAMKQLVKENKSLGFELKLKADSSIDKITGPDGFEINFGS